MSRTRLLFASTIFLASALLFLVEPIAAKQLLPIFGGSSAVWITCLVFFQAALLAAYLYAHWLTRSARFRLHISLLALAAFVALVGRISFFGPAGRFSPTLASLPPVTGIFTFLALLIGLPFLALGATSPLLQVWLARSSHGTIPYRLFALSNLASLLALGIYPTLIEPNFTLRTQWTGWCCGFVIFSILSASLGWRVSKQRIQQPNHINPEILTDEQRTPAPASKFQKALWLLLPMGASMQLSAVTAHLTQNIAAIPLLWILPLAVYLITLIAAFRFPAFLPRALITRLLVVLLAGLGYMLTQVGVTLPLKIGIFFFLTELLVAAWFLHAEACALKPEADSEATLFYLLFAAGGALGSFLIGIASPLLFSFNYDLALSFFVTAVLAALGSWRHGWGLRALWLTTSVMMLVLVFFLRTAYHHDTQVAVRNFYGSLRVKQDLSSYPPAIFRTLSNGTIQHGTQIFSSELMNTPTTYYAKDSGVGLALDQCCEARSRHIGVIGLGVGTIAAYGQPGDHITFYEINPAVIPIARQVFAYIRNSPAKVDVIEGDARTSLAKQTPQNFDVLVVDAFSGDAIPLHLLTQEAMEVYKRHLAPGGILAFHISNQHVDLEPEVALLAKSQGMQTRRVQSPINQQLGEFAATWMLVTDSPTFFENPTVALVAKEPRTQANIKLWTDDYSSLLPILRW